MLQANSILIAFSLGRECIRCLKSFVIELDPNSTPLNIKLYVIKVYGVHLRKHVYILTIA